MPNLYVVLSWFFSCWERKNCLQNWANSQKDNYFHSKGQPRTILSKKSCHFVNLLSFASISFFLSLRKITRLNSQQPKTRGHVEHLYVVLQLLRSEFLRILEIWRILEMLQEKTDDFSYSYIFSINVSLKKSLVFINKPWVEHQSYIFQVL